MKDTHESFLVMKREIERLSKKEEKNYLKLLDENQSYFSNKTNEEVLSKVERNFQSKSEKIELENLSFINSYKITKDKELIKKRNSLSDEVFLEVKQELTTFVNTPEYILWVNNKLKDICFDKASSVLYVNEITYSGMKDLFQSFEKIEVKSMSGGFIILDNSSNHTYDYSFETLIEEQKDWYYNHSGLLIK